MQITHKHYERWIRARLEIIEKYTGEHYELSFSSIYEGIVNGLDAKRITK